MPRRRHRPEPAELFAAAEAAKLLGIGLPTVHRWDESGKLPTCFHPMSSYLMDLRDDMMKLRQKIFDRERSA
ncbi:hypothetical protein [Sorangium sp. So ce363]|uniref:hypothetical protein n=1 Tax=Sorangium sp. So ce363 TaxID=3133304 RepID=UPI003F5F2096